MGNIKKKLHANISMDKRKKKLNEQQLIEAHKATLDYAQSMCVCKKGWWRGRGCAAKLPTLQCILVKGF